MSADAALPSEDDLVRALQPVRGFVLAQVIFQLNQAGWLEAMAGAPALEELAKRLGADSERLAGLLEYLTAEGIVVASDDGRVRLSAFGTSLPTFNPWYQLLVGGYGRTFDDLTKVIRDRKRFAIRDSSYVGMGSCGISQFDALPMTRTLLGCTDRPVRLVVDLGCGDGTFLADLCRTEPDLAGLGVEPDHVSVARAEAAAERLGMSDRVRFEQGLVPDAVPDITHSSRPICFLTAFVLQEILEQSGRQAILDFYSRVFGRYPDSYWIVVEVDHKADDSEIMKLPLALAYYNPYYLIHRLTEQRLETHAFWLDLFTEAGLDVVAQSTTSPVYDSLGLKRGYLLRPRQGVQR